MFLAAITTLLATATALGADIDARHVDVYYEKDYFGGWPANHGIWIWDNEILVGFSRGVYKDLGDRHHIDRELPEEYRLARSLDGGETWTVEYPNEKGDLIPEGPGLHGTELPGVEIPEWKEFDGRIDFTHPNFAFTLRMRDHHAGPSRFYYSYDRGRTWSEPFRFPNLGTPGIAARTDYHVLGKYHCRVFLTAAKPDGEEGRPLVAETKDGGKTWELVSFIGPEPDGFSIMPAALQVGEKEWIVTLRRREGPERWMDQYRSLDDCRTWTYERRAVEDLAIGNPPSLVKLEDGRLCLTYGYRGEPYSIRAKLSDDKGHTWSDEIMLRDDGLSRDVGYVRSVQRPDGKVVAVYYFCDVHRGPERYIAATIWTPPTEPSTGAGAAASGR